MVRRAADRNGYRRLICELAYAPRLLIYHNGHGKLPCPREWEKTTQQRCQRIRPISGEISDGWSWPK